MSNAGGSLARALAAVAALAAAAGCATARWEPLALPRSEPAHGGRPLRVAVLRATDVRGGETRPGWWHRVPLLSILPLAPAGHHDRPEDSAQRGPLHYGVDWPAELTAAATAELAATGAFRMAVPRDRELAELAREGYDYAARVRLDEASVKIREHRWGLDLFGLADLSGIAHALGAPTRSTRATASVTVELLELPSGNPALRGSATAMTSGHTAGWYYGGGVEGLPAEARQLRTAVAYALFAAVFEATEPLDAR
ncbi:MAG: hypothetical protein SF028_05690 [Candidatus Sumerlaeia bacterium]|nr:hypothetical protein [Candidatus Sumerlaeia bacterium]